MSQLITTTKVTEKELAAIEKLEPIKKDLILALLDSKISFIERESAGISIFEIVKIAEFDSGIGKYDNDDLIILSKSIYDLIIDRYQTLTITEFKKACKYGVINTYGEWQGMCLKTFNQWIKGYLTAEQRTTAIKEWNAKIAKCETSYVPVTDLIKFDKESCLRAFQHYKLTKEMPMACFAYYDIINELIGIEYQGKKTLITDPEIRKRLVEETKVQFNSLVNQERKKFAKTTEDFVSIVSDPKGLKGFERSLKQAFLKQYFNQLIESGKEMEL